MKILNGVFALSVLFSPFYGMLAMEPSVNVTIENEDPILRELPQHNNISYDDLSPTEKRIVKVFMFAFQEGLGGQGGQRGLKDVFQNMGEGLGVGMGKGFDLGSAFSPDKFAEAIVKASGKSVEAFGNALKEGAGEGGNFSEAFKNFANIFKGLFDNQGEGRAAINEAVKSIGDLFRNGGEGLQSVQDAMDNIVAELGEGGHAHDAQRAATREFGEFTNDIGKYTAGAIEQVQSIVRSHLIKTSIIATGAVGCITSAYFGTKVLWNWIEYRIKQPELIIESSKKSWFGWAKEKMFGPDKKLVRPMVFADDLKERLQNVVTSAKIITQKVKEGKTNVKYRNLLLHGEPGTGKTMFAKQLAYQSGMEFVMITGASFSKFIEKGEGINAMDKLFAWANRSKKGLVIFIDEIEAFVYKREKMKPGSFDLKALDNFLNHTGERSNKFMLVMATNHKDMLDKAVWDRIDDEITIPLPAFEQRVDVLKLYRDIVLFDEKQNGKEFVASAKKHLNDSKISEIAQKTEGLSNRALESLINIIKTESDITKDGLLNRRLIDASVEHAVHKYHAANLLN